MRSLWMRIRIPLAVAVLLVIALALARIFSGPEDAWIKNESGEWIRHGCPSGPPPSPGYQEPFTYWFVPLVFLVTFAVPLFFFGIHKLQNRLKFDTASRDIKFYGYLSTALFSFGILICAGLMLEAAFVWDGSSGAIQSLTVQDLLSTFLFICSLLGLAGLCILLGVQFFVLKRNCSDHYQLEKSHRELMEILQKIARC
ncbi:MAG TPA: hypothetical protein VM123_03840 [archaeon]|nr:hypothetical protein [archaeon]